MKDHLRLIVKENDKNPAEVVAIRDRLHPNSLPKMSTTEADQWPWWRQFNRSVIHPVVPVLRDADVKMNHVTVLLAAVTKGEQLIVDNRTLYPTKVRKKNLWRGAVEEINQKYQNEKGLQMKGEISKFRNGLNKQVTEQEIAVEIEAILHPVTENVDKIGDKKAVRKITTLQLIEERNEK